MKITSFFCTLATQALLLSSTHAEGSKISFDDFSAKTVAGNLEVIKKIKTPDRVFLADKVVLESDTEHTSWFVASAFPREGEARLVLLGFDTGVNTCRFLYRVLETHSNGKYSMSSDFGNCQFFEDPDLPMGRKKVKDTVRYSGANWMLAFPKDDGDGRVWYTYKNGRVYKGNMVASKPDY